MTSPHESQPRWPHALRSPPAQIRTVEVVPPSRSDEGTAVALFAGYVVLCVIYIVAFERFPSGADNATTAHALLPYQVLFRDLPAPEQRMFRSMQEGAIEGLAARSSDGAWPAVETLAARGIPPFAPDPIDKSQVRWTRRDDGLLHQYVGVPALSGAAAYLISIVEPAPVTGEKAVPGVVDEEHQLLGDGTLLHVTYWKHFGDVPGGPIADPAQRGWSQIRVKTPLEEMMEQP